MNVCYSILLVCHMYIFARARTCEHMSRTMILLKYLCTPAAHKWLPWLFCCCCYLLLLPSSFCCKRNVSELCLLFHQKVCLFHFHFAIPQYYGQAITVLCVRNINGKKSESLQPWKIKWYGNNYAHFHIHFREKRACRGNWGGENVLLLNVQEFIMQNLMP